MIIIIIITFFVIRNVKTGSVHYFNQFISLHVLGSYVIADLHLVARSNRKQEVM